jgi:hypothetical protein
MRCVAGLALAPRVALSPTLRCAPSRQVKTRFDVGARSRRRGFRCGVAARAVASSGNGAAHVLLNRKPSGVSCRTLRNQSIGDAELLEQRTSLSGARTITLGFEQLNCPACLSRRFLVAAELF